jgi:DNA-binding NarL/FixJ family response regulator
MDNSTEVGAKKPYACPITEGARPHSAKQRSGDPAPRVVVHADDPLTRDGTAAFLKSSGRVTVLPEGRLAEAQVVVMITGQVTGRTLSAMSRVARTTSGGARIVLVAETISESQLPLAVSHGLVSFLARRHADFPQIVSATVRCHQGRAVLPPALTAALLERMREMHTGATSAGLLPGSLTPREVEVLRLLGDGLEISEIAAQLSYSERLIKSIIHDVVKRLEVRNRTHAVAYAIRAGIL